MLQEQHRDYNRISICMSALDVTEVRKTYLCSIINTLILLFSLCCLLEEILATRYMKLSGATVYSAGYVVAMHR